MTARIPALALGALLLGSSLGVALPAVAAEPTLHEVYQAVQANRLTEADRMMDEVLRNHPGSAKAHYVEAELLVREGRNDAARAELAQAERLDPTMAFAKSSSLAELRQRLAQPAAGVAAPSVNRSSTVAPAPSAMRESGSQGSGGGIGTFWIIVLAGLAMFVIVRVVRGMRPPAGPNVINQGPVGPYGGQPGFGNGGPGYGPQPGYGGGPMGGGLGGGLMGGLATGVAVGAGVVAGEALMHRVIDGPDHNRGFGGGGSDFIPSADAASLPPANYDVGGQDFGVNDAGSWDSGSGGGDIGGGDSW